MIDRCQILTINLLTYYRCQTECWYKRLTDRPNILHLHMFRTHKNFDHKMNCKFFLFKKFHTLILQTDKNYK
jgi:hypothetical protein